MIVTQAPVYLLFAILDCRVTIDNVLLMNIEAENTKFHITTSVYNLTNIIIQNTKFHKAKTLFQFSRNSSMIIEDLNIYNLSTDAFLRTRVSTVALRRLTIWNSVGQFNNILNSQVVISHLNFSNSCTS